LKIYILSDMEGASGVVNFAEDTVATGRNYERGKKLLAGEVNAAVEGCLAAGATEIVVLNGHGSGGLNLEDIHPKADLLTGSPLSPPFSLDASYGGVILLAHHAMNGTAQANLCHTYSHVSVVNMWLNGEKIGEIGLEMALAGYFDVPVILVTGDEAACAEAHLHMPQIEVAAVKKGISMEVALCLHPEKARALIREKAEKAVQRLKEIPPFKPKPPFEIRTEFISPGRAFAVSRLPGVEMIDPRTVAMRGDDFLELFRFRCSV